MPPNPPNHHQRNTSDPGFTKMLSLPGGKGDLSLPSGKVDPSVSSGKTDSSVPGNKADPPPLPPKNKQFPGLLVRVLGLM